MNTEQQRIAIAEACGWEQRHNSAGVLVAWQSPGAYKAHEPNQLPDYLNDLNAMHDAKRKLLTTFELCDLFNDFLLQEKLPWLAATFETDRWSWGQSAEIEARALIKTIGKWTANEI